MTTDHSEPSPARNSLALLGGAAGLLLAASAILVWRTPDIATAGLTALAAWTTGFILRQGISCGSPASAGSKWLAFLLSRLALTSALVTLTAAVALVGFIWALTGASASLPAMRFNGVLLLVLVVPLHFVARLTGTRIDSPQGQFLIAPVRLAHVLTVGVTLVGLTWFFQIYAPAWKLGAVVGASLYVLVGALVVDILAESVVRFYWPGRGAASAGDSVNPPGAGVLLDLAFRRGAGLTAWRVEIERTFGVDIRQFAAAKVLASAGSPALMALGLLVWLSTGVTAVPLGSEGVVTDWGALLPTPLPPGLHVTPPWPAGSVAIIPTTRLQEVVLGFDRDLGVPVLWNEKHFENEHNLLVGGGEALLTTNVPIEFRVRDSIAWLRGARDVPAALQALAYRQWTAVTARREAFHIMVEDRAEIAANMKTALQADCDAAGLGVEIVMIHLKDIHPPVSVASDFQAVISAEEQKATLLNEAQAYRSERLSSAAQQASRIRVESTALAVQRIAIAEGEADRFSLVLAGQSSAPHLFRFRLWHEAISSSLAPAEKWLAPGAGSGGGEFILDARKPAPSLPAYP